MQRSETGAALAFKLVQRDLVLSLHKRDFVRTEYVMAALSTLIEHFGVDAILPLIESEKQILEN